MGVRGVGLCVFVLGIAACAPGAAAPMEEPTTGPLPATPTMHCTQEEILPQILQVRPLEIKPGSEVTLSGAGGYIKDGCGGYNESARSYKVFLDDQAVGELVCYVNHCEGKFTLAHDIAAGSHCLGIQPATCQLELKVTSE